jgi:hypothetical protein
VKNHIPLSLSIQREIEKHPVILESEIDKSMGSLGFNWRKFITLAAQRVLAIVDNSPDK